MDTNIYFTTNADAETDVDVQCITTVDANVKKYADADVNKYADAEIRYISNSNHLYSACYSQGLPL